MGPRIGFDESPVLTRTVRSRRNVLSANLIAHSMACHARDLTEYSPDLIEHGRAVEVGLPDCQQDAIAAVLRRKTYGTVCASGHAK